jgi:hypothetical protein
VTAAIALLILPDGESGDADLGAPPPAAAAGDTVATPGGRTDGIPDTPVATATTEPSPAPTRLIPTPTARDIRRPSPTDSPSPTRAPGLGDNLVVNGGFSDGLANWYSEEDAGVAAGAGRRNGPAGRIGSAGGYADQQIPAVPGRSYRLLVWGRVSGGGDSGVVGIIYRDAAGNRLEDEEPPPLVVNETTLTSRSLRFTPPADAATVRVYFWKRPGPADLFVDDVSVREYLTLSEPTSTP